MRKSLYSTKCVAGAAAIAFTLVACGGGEKAATDTSAAKAMAPAGSTAVAAVVTPAPGGPPAGATAAMVAEGDSIFHGKLAGGLCFTCHGVDANGGPLAPSLTDTVWITGDGSYAFIQKRVTTGMPTPTKPYITPMLPMGGAQLTPDQIKAVASYVYSISHHGG
jgi:mono/diheme cytochrome c family protein